MTNGPKFDAFISVPRYDDRDGICGSRGIYLGTFFTLAWAWVVAKRECDTPECTPCVTDWSGDEPKVYTRQVTAAELAAIERARADDLANPCEIPF